jgi:probable HAF family extracellular repeat protein
MRFTFVTLAAALAVSGCAMHGAVPQNGAPSSERALSSAAGHRHAAYTVMQLATLGGSSASANGINDQGWSGGDSSLSNGSYIHAALWKGNAAPIDLGTLGGPNSNISWQVKDVHGAMAGVAETAKLQPLKETWSCALASFPSPATGHTCLGFVWAHGKMRGLPTLGGDNSYAAGTNKRGDVAGWAEDRIHDTTCVKPQVLQFEAVVYHAGGKVQELPPLGGDVDGAATSVNDAGVAVGISGICDQAEGRFTAEHAVMWVHGVATDLGNIGGLAWNTPTYVNDRGDVVGFADLPGDSNGTPNFHAFLWTKQRGMIDLGTLPHDVYSQAWGINDRDQIVGVSYGKGFATARAFLYEHGKMYDLNSVAGSPALYLLAANDINDRGQIAGQGCVLTSSTCSTTPAFVASPNGGRLTDAAPRPAPPLPAAVRAALLRRTLMP